MCTLTFGAQLNFTYDIGIDHFFGHIFPSRHFSTGRRGSSPVSKIVCWHRSSESIGNRLRIYQYEGVPWDSCHKCTSSQVKTLEGVISGLRLPISGSVLGYNSLQLSKRLSYLFARTHHVNVKFLISKSMLKPSMLYVPAHLILSCAQFSRVYYGSRRARTCIDFLG